MAVTLNHTVVPARDKRASAALLARVLGVGVAAPVGPFIPVRVNENLTLDFADPGYADTGHTDVGAPHHYAFAVDEDEFDEIFGRIRSEGLRFYAEPHEPRHYGEINLGRGGRAVYFDDPDGHVFEVMTTAQ